jgi:hypothetical protein
MMERLQMLMAAHYEFVKAAGLPEGARPYNIQSRLDIVGKRIMEELEKQNNPIQTAKNDDDIPF